MEISLYFLLCGFLKLQKYEILLLSAMKYLNDSTVNSEKTVPILLRE